jgi:hypothetical protein
VLSVLSTARTCSHALYTLVEGNGFVVVGDSPQTGSSYQYRNARFVYRHPLISLLSSHFHLIKIEPVTFQGFFPAALAKNIDVPYVGQNITMVGYGLSYSHEGEGAVELSVPVKNVSADGYFKAGGDDNFKPKGDDDYFYSKDDDPIFPHDDHITGTEAEIGPCIGAYGKARPATFDLQSTDHIELFLLMCDAGDYGIPAVDQSNTLVGIADEPGASLSSPSLCSVPGTSSGTPRPCAPAYVASLSHFRDFGGG